ncbi:hypothetical protein ACVIJ6_005064 [Bradyrhizobium sp. USDA 4369]
MPIMIMIDVDDHADGAAAAAAGVDDAGSDDQHVGGVA